MITDRSTQQIPLPNIEARALPRQFVRERLHPKEEQMVSVQ